ncbi:MAG: hypothetical protein QN128_03145, partial [Armatimonadota bacterium]|nr:hypothetical protein [Armatimonadota bacterium]
MSGTPTSVSAAHRLLVWLYLPTLALSVGQGMIFPAIPKLAEAFQVSAGTAGQVVTAFGAGRVHQLDPLGPYQPTAEGFRAVVRPAGQAQAQLRHAPPPTTGRQ